MKRNLFPILLAVMLVAAVVFVAAPNAKAATILTPADADENGTITISTAGQILDLRGANLTVVFTENVELSVIDTTIKQNQDGTNNAGTLTVEGAGSIAAVSVDPTSRMRFLAIATDGVYSAYPFNLAISQAGINTIAKNPDDKTLEEPATCIRASFMAFKPVIDEIDAYGFIVNGNKYAATKTFTTNITHAYADLQGTLRESIIDNPVSIQAYMTINGKDYVSSAVTVIPREILKKINKDNVTPTAAQKERLMALIGSNARVANLLTNMQSYTETTTTTNTLSFADKAQRAEFSTSKQVWVQNGITMTNNKSGATTNVADYANPVRLYKSSTITIEATGMTSIVFTSDGGSEYKTALNTTLTDAGYTVSVSGNNYTITFAVPTDSITLTLSGQVRLQSLKITATKTVTNTVTCKHGTNLSEATCSAQAVCIDCNQPYGETTDHDTIVEATCTEKAQCSVCGEYGETIPHNTIAEATCIAKAQCDNCGEYGEVDVNNHTSLSEATCQAPIHCSGCGIDIGDVVDCKDTDGDGLCNWCLTNLATKPKETITVSKSAANIMSLAGLSTTNGTSINGKTIKLDDNISIVASKGTSTSNPAYYSNAIRLYQNGATLTIKAAEGCTLKTIVITAASGGQGPISVTGGTASALSGGKYTITVNEGATEVVIKTTGTSSGTRVYLSNIEVIYEK